MADTQHFDKIFYFICGLVLLVIAVDVFVMFGNLSSVGQKYADNNLPVLNTGAMLAGIYYLLGGNPANKKADQVITGDNTSVDNTKTS